MSPGTAPLLPWARRSALDASFTDRTTDSWAWDYGRGMRGRGAGLRESRRAGWAAAAPPTPASQWRAQRRRTDCSKRALASSKPPTACPAPLPYLALTVSTSTSLRNLQVDGVG